MPRVSVFTPSHRPSFLDACWASLQAQTFRDFEWVVLLNAGALWQPPADERVRVLRADSLTGVGAVKRHACAQLTGELFVELDHDDLLATDALAEVVAAFDAHPEVGFVYSDFAQIQRDGSRDDSRFDQANGWVYAEDVVDGRPVLRCEAMEPLPHNVSFIWFAPNHVRAFRREAYEAVGGYDAGRDVLDDQDLMGRLFQHTAFLRIPRCLYLQRMHGANTQHEPTLNARIQSETVELYERDVQANALAWSRRHGLAALTLGEEPGQAGQLQHVELDPDAPRLELADASVGLIRAVDALARVADKVALFNELHRVLAHGGLLLSLTPSTDGRGAFLDPAARSYWNETSFWPFTDRRFAAGVPGLACRFQVSRLQSTLPTDWHREQNLPYVQANLIAIKSGARHGGHLTV